MLDNFNLVGKKQLLRNKVEWEESAVFTNKNAPFGIYLSADDFPADYKEWEKLSREIWDYLNG